MTAFLLALVPVIAIVTLGRVLAFKRVILPDGWRGLERISYFILFPALIVRALAHAPFETAPWGLAFTLMGAQLLLGLVGWMGAWGRLQNGRPSVGSVIQSNVRWNTFIALSIAGALFGDTGLALVAVAAAAMIPVANLLSVTALTHFAERDIHTRPNVAKGLITNPLILACVIGLTLNISGFAPSGVIDQTLDILGQATIALGLLAAGAAVNFSILKTAKSLTLIWSVVRLAGLPLFVFGLGTVFGLSSMHLAIAVICAATPTATNGYILAQQLGGDAPLSANLIAAQTLLAVITMPLIYGLVVGWT